MQWGAWAEVGMATRGPASERMAAMEAASGFGRISLAKGLAALQLSMIDGTPPVLEHGTCDVEPLLGGWQDACAAFRVRASTSKVEISRSCAASGVVSLEEVLAMVHRTAGGSADADVPLMDAGLDSLGAVELRNQLQQAAGEGAALPSTLVFDHPTARQIAALLTSSTPCDASTARSVITLVPSGSSSSSVDVAGVAITTANVTTGLKALREVSSTSMDLLSEIPSMRWDVSIASAELTGAPPEVARRIRHGGFLSDAELFAPIFFGTSPSEAAAMDPQQRLLLELGYAALHDAGMVKSVLVGSVTAVSVGQWASEFGSVLASSDAGRSVYAATGSSVRSSFLTRCDEKYRLLTFSSSFLLC